MAPSQSPLLSQPASSQKKQQSISSFFTSKSIPAPPRQSSTVSSQNGQVNSLGHGNGLFVSHDDTGVESHDSPRGTKRSPVGEHGLPRAKRIRQTSQQENEDPQGGTLDEHDEAMSPITNRPSTQTISKGARVTDRTSKYLASSPPEAVEDKDEETRRYRDRLHQKFVKKLGRPDSIADIKRRNHFITEETEDAAAEDEADEEDEEERKAAKSGKGQGRKSSSKLTPGEKQYLDIKCKNLDKLLLVETGYKYKIWGEDARAAAKELQIVCIPGKFRYDEHPSEAHLDRFASASFPVHRLHVHVKRLVQAGHKVGVVRQLETAALKAVGNNRNAPFVRKLTNVYTKGTYIDENEGLEAGPTGGAQATGHLLCLTETNAKGWGTDEQVRLGIIAVQPTTGDIVYDDFEDGFMRSELETRLLHIAPCELLIVGEVSKATNKVVEHLASSTSNVFGDKLRVERVEKPKTMAAQAYKHVTDFYADKISDTDSAEERSTLLDKAHKLSELVTICLSAMITHLKEYGLEHVFDLTKYFQAFSARSHMMLNGNTLTSLEIFQNQTDQTANGSLFWTLDRTQTQFGRRMLRKWVGRPLLDQKQLEERTSAIEELMDSSRIASRDKISRLLRLTKSDLERSLIRIYYGKCLRPELLTVLQTLQRIANEYADVQSPEQSGFSALMIGKAIATLPKISEDVVSYLERINLNAAKEDNKYKFFREEHETEDITDHNVGIVSIEMDLNEHKQTIAETLKVSKVAYVTVAGIEYLVEVENTRLKNVPASWAKISGTKKVSRFHTPEVIRLVRERDQHKEALANACDAAFSALLAEISTKYQIFRDCIQSLATLDCLLSLAEIASQPGYVKPTFVSSTSAVIDVQQARHPMVEQLLLDSYVPNDISLASDSTRGLLITGPNMGGKSSYVRSVALVAIMAQIGSYVPASSARLSLLDAVYTRMGAFDNMMKGESTFMVELSETSDILKQAGPRSLIILDELGRGTSTHDGVAIAAAVLDYVMREVKSLVLFITHYQTLAKMSEAWRGSLLNVHMQFEESRDERGEEVVTFLYEVGEGVSHRSYGLNVARLAGLPRGVIDVAREKSRDMEGEERKRRLAYFGRLLPKVLNGEQGGLRSLQAAMEQM